MDDLFHQLERHLRSLIHKYEYLKQSNFNLTQHQSTAEREKELLLAKNKIAISQIENMVSRLKSTESAT